MKIAVFDVDKTLLRGDSLLLAARKSNSYLGLILHGIIFIPYLIAWKLRLINTKRFKEKFIKRFQICKKYNSEISNNNQDWLINDLEKLIRKEALDRLNMHKEKGHIVVLCSASPDMILEPLANTLNVDLICTNLLKIDNKWTAKIEGNNCKGVEKLKRLKDKYGSIEHQKLEVYGDSKGDREILNSAWIPHYRDFSDYPKEYPSFSLSSIIPIVGIVLLIYLILNNFESLISTERQWNAIWINILIGEFLVIISYIIRFFRWKIMLESIGLYPPILKSIYIWMGSFAFTATPGKTGEGVRVILLNKECNLPILPVILSLFIERLTDAIAVLIILFLNLNIIPLIDFKNNIILLFIPIIIILFIFFRKRIQRILILTIETVLPSKKISLNNNHMKIIKILICPKNITISTILGLFAWIIEGSSFFIILKGFDLSISLMGATFAHTTSSLIGALTFMPGGLGATEASTIGILSLQGIPLSVGTSATLLIRLMTLWFATALGIICLLLNNYTKTKKTYHLLLNKNIN